MIALLTGALWLVTGIGIPALWLYHCWLWLKWGHTELWPGLGGAAFLRRDTNPLLYWLHLTLTGLGSTFLAALGWAFADAMLFC
jgi:hypothetical protein